MSERDLKLRTRQFALAVIRLYVSLPKTTEAQVLGKQALRSGTSVGAHYHEGQRAKSNPDLISKLQGGLQELEETSYWLSLLEEANIVSHNQVKDIHSETEQLIAIFVSIIGKVKQQGYRTQEIIKEIHEEGEET